MSKLKITWQHIRRSPYQAIAAILSLFLTLFVTSVFITTVLELSAILSYFEKKPQITVFFKDEKDGGMSSEAISDLQRRLVETTKISKIKLISKEQALEIYKEQNKNDPLLLEMVTADILPASLEISAKDIKDLSVLAQILNNEKGIEEIIYQKDIIDTLIKWTATIRVTGLILISILLVVTLLVILTIIAMKIALKKEEIEILRLLGATNWYIRTPFVLEGVVYGIVSAVMAWIILYILLLNASGYFGVVFKNIPSLSLSGVINISLFSGVLLWPISFFYMMLLLFVMILFATFIGVAGSILAIHRYLG